MLGLIRQEDAMTTKLSPSSARVLAAIESFRFSHGYSPTIQELAEACDYRGTGGMNYQLHYLRARGYINFEDGKKRTIVVLKGTL